MTIYFFYVVLMSEIPYIKAISIPEYKYKQSKYEMTPKLPFRAIVVASSTGGRFSSKTFCWIFTVVLLKQYIYILSPSIHSDPAFYEVKTYQKEGLKVYR